MKNINKNFKDDKSKRELVIAPWIDRWIQGALELPMKQVYSWNRSKNSIGYVPNISREDIIKEWFRKEIWKVDVDWIIEADIKNCFPSIPHEVILKSVRNWDNWNYKNNAIGFKILKDMLTKGYISEDRCEKIETDKGTPQGNVWSPVLANIVMDNLDN